MIKLIPGICTQCGATLSVNKSEKAMICPYCNTSFIVEKAIQNFNTTYNTTNNIAAQNVFVQGENKEFEIVGGVLKKYKGSATNVIIPNGVSKLGRSAFEGTMINKVVIPDSVAVIDERVFENCINLQEILLPNSLKALHAYSLPPNIKEILIPKSTEEITWLTFSSCKELETLYLSKEAFNKIVDSIGGMCTVLPKLKNIYIDGNKLDYRDKRALEFVLSPIRNMYLEYLKDEKEKQRQRWKQERRCQYCGGGFGGLITIKCKKCGMPKDY